MIVKIRKARANNWTGLKTFTGGISRHVAGVDPRTGNIVTGLTKDEAREIEEELNHPPGTLAYNSPFWQSWNVTLLNGEGEFDTSLAEDLLKYKVLSAQKKYATSLSELKTNSIAEFVMYSDDEVAKEENIKFDVKVEAFSELAKLYNSLEDMRNVLIQYGKRAESISLDVAKSQLAKEVEINPKRFLTIVKDTDFKSKVLIADLVRFGILGKKGSSYTHDGAAIAFSQEEMISFLKIKDNSNQVLSFKSQLKEKTK